MRTKRSLFPLFIETRFLNDHIPLRPKQDFRSRSWTFEILEFRVYENQRYNNNPINNKQNVLNMRTFHYGRYVKATTPIFAKVLWVRGHVPRR